MATVTKQPTRHRWVLGESDSRPNPRRRWHWMLAAAGVLAILVWLAPIVVAHSPLLSWIVGMATADMRGKVQVASASLGWFSPVVISGLELRDEKNQPVLEVSEIAGDKSLLGLLVNSSRLGRFRAEKPKLTLVLRDDGSNLEDVLAAYLQGESSGPVDVQVEIVDGQVLVADPRVQRSWLIENLQLTCSLPSDESLPTEFQASGQVVDPHRPGRFAAAMKLGQADQKPDTLSLKTENLPLAMLAPVVSRLASGTRIEGWLSTAIECQGGDLATLQGGAVQGQAVADQFRLTSPQLGTDQVTLSRLQANGQLAWQGPRLQVDRLVVESEVARASATGVVELAASSSGTAEKTGQAAATSVAGSGRYELHGQVDLVRLAAMLPATLHLREDTRVTSGQLQITFTGQPGPEGMTWQGQIDARDLTADNQGRRLAWPQPILVAVAARQSRQELLVVDHLRCESDFLKIDGSGTTEEFGATANLDLNRLVGQLNGLVDFGGLTLAGAGSARLHWKQPSGEDFQADGQLQVQGFRLALADRPPWTEELLTADVSARGRTDFSSQTRLDTASLEVSAGQDRLGARLIGPVADVSTETTWPLAIGSSGELARWVPRLSPWLTLDGWQLAGQLAGQAELRASSTGVAAHIDASVANLRVAHSSGQQFQEPQVRLVARGGYQNQTGLLVVEQAELTAAALGVAGGGQYATKDDAADVQVSGKVHYDLEKLSALLRSYLGDGLYAAGRGTSPIAYRGPLAATGGQGTAGFGWQWLGLYGFEVGPGELQASLAGNLLQVRPLDLAVSEGRVRLASQLSLADGSMTLAVAPGRLADQIRINPRMCAHALQYIAPVMAGVATADGRFSIEIDACRIPLNDPTHGEIGGRMIVHSVEVGPGPLTQELAVLLGRPYPARLTRESAIPFRLVDGRVHHQNLELVFPDLTIRTNGSVGLDRTLAVMAEMPVPPKWIGDNPLGTALRNQVIRVPIGGTLTQPALDKPTLDRLSQQFVRNAAQNLLQDTLNKHQGEIQTGLDKVNKKLDRLFGPPPEAK